MPVPCNTCKSTGFINLEQVDYDTLNSFLYYNDEQIILNWMQNQTKPHDVAICNCCGDGVSWYGVRGEHYNDDDPQGPDGPYAYNGGLCECH